MFKVISNDILAENLHRMVIEAPRVAAARRPGQFVIIHAERSAERIPLTIGDADPAAGTITIFVQAVGASTMKIVSIPAGGFIRDVAGPLGNLPCSASGRGSSASAAALARRSFIPSSRHWPRREDM